MFVWLLLFAGLTLIGLLLRSRGRFDPSKLSGCDIDACQQGQVPPSSVSWACSCREFDAQPTNTSVVQTVKPQAVQVKIERMLLASRDEVQKVLEEASPEDLPVLGSLVVAGTASLPTHCPCSLALRYATVFCFQESCGRTLIL